MAWYDKYTSGQAGMMGGQRFTPEQALAIRKMEFEQQMEEQKERDKYIQKMERRERRRNRKPISKRMGPQKRRRPKPAPYLQRSPVGGGNRNKLYTWDGKPIRHSQVGMSGAPQFQNLAQMGFQSPQQMGFGNRPTSPTVLYRGAEKQDAQRLHNLAMARAWAEQRKDKD